jgi:hypothetical protein
MPEQLNFLDDSKISIPDPSRKKAIIMESNPLTTL